MITYYEKIRIYPNLHQEELFFKYLDINRGIYNSVIFKQRQALKTFKALKNTENTGIFEIEDIVEFPKFNSEIKELTLKRKASSRIASCLQEIEAMTIKRAFNAMKRRTKGQHLQFKKSPRFRTITLGHANRAVKFSPNGRKLKFSKDIGWIKFKNGRKIPQNFTLMSLHHKNGKWYVIFNCEREAIKLPPNNQSIGIDLGITNILADSNGVLVQNPRWIEKKALHLAKLQRKFAKKKYQSLRLAKQIAKLHEKISNQKRDFYHKLALNVVQTNDFIAIEDLSFNKMKISALKGVRKGLQNVSLAQLTKYLCDKAESAGRRVAKVNPAYTSQTCSSCGYRNSDNRCGEEFECGKCGFISHADINAALNILVKGLQISLGEAYLGAFAPIKSLNAHAK